LRVLCRLNTEGHFQIGEVQSAALLDDDVSVREKISSAQGIQLLEENLAELLDLKIDEWVENGHAFYKHSRRDSLVAGVEIE
jgi:hypothetical protein